MRRCGYWIDDPFFRLSGSARMRSLRVACLLVTLLGSLGLPGLCAGAVAAANVSIERVWSFKGGAVDVVRQGNDRLVGVVSAPTKFATCVHPSQEQMWVGMTRQPDGSYWGLHRWYFEPPGCVPNPVYGPTAWRVLETVAGEAFLRVCFSAPGSEEQPTIAADGSHEHASYGCVDSSAIAPLPPIPPNEGVGAPFAKAVALPSPAEVCRGGGSLKIVLHDPRYDPLKRVVVWVDGKRAAEAQGTRGRRHDLVLRHLPSGGYTVKVLAITILNHRLAGGRSYGRCGPASGRINLHNEKRRRRHPGQRERG